MCVSAFLGLPVTTLFRVCWVWEPQFAFWVTSSRAADGNVSWFRLRGPLARHDGPRACSWAIRDVPGPSVVLAPAIAGRDSRFMVYDETSE